MSISHPNILFNDLGPVELEKKRFLSHLSVPAFLSNPLISIPIAERLILGFLIPALIAAFAASFIGIQSTQVLNQESGFYQNLFQSYSSLTTGNNYLQLMSIKLNTTLSDAAANSPQTQLVADQQAMQGLETRYNTILQDYIQHDLLIHNPSQTAFFDEAGYPGQDTQQSLLASSAVRTWQTYQSAQDEILQDVLHGLYQHAETLEQQQGQLTYSDALSALRQLIQLDGRLTTYIQVGVKAQQTSAIVTTLIAVLLVLLSIGLIGWLIYGTLVSRLRRLRKVAQEVQRGQVKTRATVDGHDEITDVSISVNTMLDTIVGLVEESRVQRDAIISAAENLFTEMRLANEGEFDVRTAKSDDPIWMLGHAFNFTIGRFRRFVSRNQTTVNQLDVISQQGMKNANAFLTTARRLLHDPASSPSYSPSNPQNATDTSMSLDSTRVQELAHLSESFAREVAGLIQNLRRVTEEMRAGLAPFRSEATQSGQQDLASRNSQQSGGFPPYKSQL
jgi:methyl-accepting chemotaxis protein